jgi:hypothetical protein
VYLFAACAGVEIPATANDAATATARTCTAFWRSVAIDEVLSRL